MLPEKWYVQCTKENYKALNEFYKLHKLEYGGM